MRGEIWRRSKRLIAAILGELRGEDRVDLGELIHTVAGAGDGWSKKTVANAIADLEAFGAVRKSGRPGETRVEVTVLGEAWLQGELLPSVADRDDLVEAMAELFD